MRSHRQAVSVVFAAALVAAGAVSGPATASADPAATYTVTVGSTGTYQYPTDTPAAVFTDSDGTFHFQQSAALYGADDPRYWEFYTGTDLDTATRDAGLSDAVDPANPADRNNDTTWRCNNSPTGKTASYDPAGSGYAQKNYCDLVGTWVDPDTGDWYGLVHNEFTPRPFGDGLHFDAIDCAVSTDKGHTWSIKGHAITSPYSTTRGDTNAFPNQTFDYGDGDQRLFVDPASGYFYAYYGSRIVDKGHSWRAFYSHVARAPIAGKMATGTWQKFYDGSWHQPGVGGKESNLVPVSADNPNGYTPPAKEYDPANAGTTSEQIAAGKTPPTSPLFVMDITYNAYLGLYLGEPQSLDQSGNAPQQIYATKDLAAPKWRLLGDTGSYHTASWYRWFLDSKNRTSSTIVGKGFRMYCSIACDNSDGQYADVTIDSSAPAAAPVNPSRKYLIASGEGQALAQVGSATTSVPVGTRPANAAWSIVANGDGSYRIVNGVTGQALGVDSATTTSRAWGTRPTVTALGAGGPSVGQQWFVVGNTVRGGTYRLVNRYSGLVLGLSGQHDRPVETTPLRTWTGHSADGTRTAAEQTMTFVPFGR